MNLTALPTLKKIVSLKVAAQVCSLPDIRPMIENYTGPLSQSQKLEVKETLASLDLPEILQDGVVTFVKPVMIEIRSWMLYVRHIHNEVERFTKTSCSCLDDVDLQEALRWQSVGLIDKPSTARGLARDERLDAAFRFVLACNYCSEIDIPVLWGMLSDDERLTFSTSKFYFIPIVNFWVEHLNKTVGMNHSGTPTLTFPSNFPFDENPRFYLESWFIFYAKLPLELRGYLFGTNSLNPLVREFVFVDNVAAMKYFLRELRPVTGRKFLEVVAKSRFITNELLVYCLSRMRNDQVTKMLGNKVLGLRILSCLLYFPWQESFWDLTDRIWNILSVHDIIKLIVHLTAFKRRGGWQDLDYQSIIKKLRSRCTRLTEARYRALMKSIARVELN